MAKHYYSFTHLNWLEYKTLCIAVVTVQTRVFPENCNSFEYFLACGNVCQVHHVSYKDSRSCPVASCIVCSLSWWGPLWFHVKSRFWCTDYTESWIERVMFKRRNNNAKPFDQRSKRRLKCLNRKERLSERLIVQAFYKILLPSIPWEYSRIKCSLDAAASL